MKAKILMTITLSFFTILSSCNGKSKDQKKPTMAMATTSFLQKIDGITIHEPKTVQNLSVFMLTGEEGIAGNAYKTLSDAMKNKQVIVRETGNVNTLSIDNTSEDYVFIHSGDIVKGGKQDRTISYDIIIPPHAKAVPLESFCVEQGRWQKRANEQVTSFGSNTKMLSSRNLKLAARYDKDQSKVWSEVAAQKNKLNETLSHKNGYKVEVASEESETSLQLALENEELVKAKEEMHLALKELIKTPNAIGYAYAINGEIYGVETYNNNLLFEDLWDRILESILVEAISVTNEDIVKELKTADVMAYMSAVKQDTKGSVKQLNTSTNFKTFENKETREIVFTTEDLHKKQWIHKSYLKGENNSKKNGK